MHPKKHSVFKLWFDRLLSQSLFKQLVILSIVLFFALVLSYIFLSFSNTEWKRFCEEHDLSQCLLPIYLLIDSNALNTLYIGNVEAHEKAVHGWMLFASSITFLIGAIIFNGIIISIITTSIERRVEKHKEGNIYYLKSGHHIIMGYDEVVPSIISNIFLTDKQASILILSSAETNIIREKLLKSFTAQQMKKIIINYGHRVSSDIYDDIHVESANQIYVVGNHNKPEHDAINVECVDCICRYLNRFDITNRPNRITCFFKDIDTYAAFKTSNIFINVSKLGIEFIPYNIYAGWAKQVFVKRKYHDFNNPDISYSYPSLYGNGIGPEDDKFVHLLFIGTTNFSIVFAMEAAQIFHFSNYRKHKTKITFIDVRMDKERDEFITRNRHFFEVEPFITRNLRNNTLDPNPHLETKYLTFNEHSSGFLDIQFEFIEGDVFSKNVQDQIRVWADEHKKRKQHLSIFLALSDQHQNFLMSMNMPDDVYDNSVNLFIRQDRSDNFVTNLRIADQTQNLHPYSWIEKDGSLRSKTKQGRYANIYPFGMNETSFCFDHLSFMRAKLINYLYWNTGNETFKFQDLSSLDAIPKQSIWEDANHYWNKLSVAHKWSNLYNAYAIKTKIDTLRTLRHLDINDNSHDMDPLSDYEIEILARIEHNRWNVEKLLMGYRKAKFNEDKYYNPDFGETLSKNKKIFIHHDIREYEKLDKVAKLDKEFARYLPWILKMTQFSTDNQ